MKHNINHFQFGLCVQFRRLLCYANANIFCPLTTHRIRSGKVPSVAKPFGAAQFAFITSRFLPTTSPNVENGELDKKELSLSFCLSFCTSELETFYWCYKLVQIHVEHLCKEYVELSWGKSLKYIPLVS